MSAPVRSYGVATPGQLTGKTGLQFLHAVIAGELPQPPIFEVLHVGLAEAGDGFAVVEGETAADILNPVGSVHGGWALTLIDAACGCAAQTLLPADVGYITVETKTNFTRPILQDTGRVRAEATVIGRGRQIMSSEARVMAPDGRVLAHGTSTLLVLRTAGS